jgi:hypothetical protein
MNGRPSPDRLLRRSHAIGWATGVGASLATLGLIVGVTHSQTTASGSTTSSNTNSSTTSSSTNKGSSGNSSAGGTVQQAPAVQQPVAASHGS